MDETPAPTPSMRAERHRTQTSSKNPDENISRTVVVTGATGGTGTATVKALLPNGYRV